MPEETSKYHVVGHRKKSTFRRRPSWFACRKALRRVLATVIIAGPANAVFSAGLLLSAEDKPSNTSPPSPKKDNHASIPAVEPIRTVEGLAALRQKELKLAEELLRDFPGRDDSLAVMGNVLYRRGNAVEAEKFWKEALEINPKRADVLRSMGWHFLKKGNYEQSIAHYRKALEIDPELIEARSNVGRVLMMSGRHSEAVEELEKVIQMAPESSFALFLLGQTYFQQKEYDRAKKYYEKAVEIEPDYANAYYGLTSVCASLGHRDQAKAYAATFRKLKAEARRGLKARKSEYDDFAETQRNAAITYINVGRMYRENGKFPKAEKLLKYAAGLDPNNVVSYLELGSLYQTTGQPAKTIEMYRRITEIQPKAAMPYLVIGMLSGQLKRYDDSEKAFRKVITLIPNRPEGYRELARLYLKMGKNLPMARQLAYKALKLDTGAATCFVFAWACDEIGDKANAQAAIKRAITLDPENKQYQRLYQVIQQRK